MTDKVARGCSELDISCYSNDSVAVMLESGIKSRHHLEARFQKLCRTIAQLGAEKKGHHNLPRKTPPHRRSSNTSRIHFRGACWTSSRESCPNTRSAPDPEHVSRGHSAFRKALKEARDILGVRGTQSDVVAPGVQEASPASKTYLSVQDESASVSVSYEEAGQTTSSPPRLAVNRGRSSSTHEPGRKGKATQNSVRSNPPRPRSRPEETGRKQPDVETEHYPIVRLLRDTESSSRARKTSQRRVKTVYVEAKRGGSNGKRIKVRLKLNNGCTPESSSSDYNASNNEISISKNNRTANTAPCRSTSLHQRSRAMDSMKEDHSKQRKRAAGYEALEERKRASSTQNNERMCSRWQDKEREPTLGKLRVEDERCYDGGHQENEPKGKERHVTYEGVSDSRSGWNQHSETEKDASDQQRWRNRGQVLWSTHAEPAARAAPGSIRAALHTFRSDSSQPATRPYYGLYARSLQANGIDPTNFRESRLGCDAAGLSCAVAHKHVDGSLLWRKTRGDDSFVVERTRAPTDGLSDRHEAGRVLDSLNRRAELLGTMPPTPLRAKAAWMESPGEPEYSLRESSSGLLSSFCDNSSPLSTSLRAARADRRFANYSLCAGNTYVGPSAAAATTLLEAASAWITPYSHHSGHTCVGAKVRGEETPHDSHLGRSCGYHMREGCERAGKRSSRTRCPCRDSAGDRSRRSHAKLRCGRNDTTSVGGAARFVGRGVAYHL